MKARKKKSNATTRREDVRHLRIMAGIWLASCLANSYCANRGRCSRLSWSSVVSAEEYLEALICCCALTAMLIKYSQFFNTLESTTHIAGERECHSFRTEHHTRLRCGTQFVSQDECHLHRLVDVAPCHPPFHEILGSLDVLSARRLDILV